MKTDLSRVNLNLLTTFHVLLKEQHVTRAARILNLSQSAVSNALKQLRHLFQDELFLRGRASQLRPTSRAIELAPKIAELMAQLNIVFQEPLHFDPKTAKQNFILGLSDYSEMVLLPHLVQFLSKEAPGVSLTIQPVNYITDDKLLENDNVDLIIGIFYTELPKNLIARTIFTDHPVCAGWEKNPVLQKKITLDVFIKTPQIVISYPKERSDLYSESLLKKLGRERKVVATVPRALAALYSLPYTNLICAVPECMAKKVIHDLPLAIQPMTFIKGCTCSKIEMVWHPKQRNNPAHRWLRETIISIAEKI